MKLLFRVICLRWEISENTNTLTAWNKSTIWRLTTVAWPAGLNPTSGKRNKYSRERSLASLTHCSILDSCLDNPVFWSEHREDLLSSFEEKLCLGRSANCLSQELVKKALLLSVVRGLMSSDIWSWDLTRSSYCFRHLLVTNKQQWVTTTLLPFPQPMHHKYTTSKMIYHQGVSLSKHALLM